MYKKNKIKTKKKQKIDKLCKKRDYKSGKCLDDHEDKPKNVFGMVKNIACDNGNTLCKWGLLPDTWCKKIEYGCKIASQLEDIDY